MRRRLSRSNVHRCPDFQGTATLLLPQDSAVITLYPAGLERLGSDFGRGPGNGTRGPHAPEPWRRGVLECPGAFPGGRLNSDGVGFVSFGDLSEPSVSGNA
jgi:hypothetical protein